MSDHFSIVRDIQATLKYHSLLGIENYPAGDDVRKFLNTRVVSPALAEEMRPQAVVSKPVRPGVTGIETPSPAPSLRVDNRTAEQKGALLEEIAVEVKNCKRCGLGEKRIVAVPGSGKPKVRIAIVGDWLAVENPDNLVSNTLFGIEQDRMLGKMMGAITIKPEDVFITNVIKCGIARSEQPKAEHARACFGYLQRQVMAVEPEVIFSMGVIATKALLNRSESLSRLRGRLHSYQLGEGKRIPLIATYHPTYLLQNPEMKRATWVDLQMLARQLGIDLS
ncbi:uracil-DNA glycosylase [Desulfosediminicola ganghwensis]|uniref:uracil-DNA glycosylase n=1 Tax=Desulfosediminicola ganghwensis TaxID=2569540 RepID=UPI0010ABC8B9|nr:uracil-DNA glycosylase [Desulfosediminicola ganghwensis]